MLPPPPPAPPPPPGGALGNDTQALAQRIIIIARVYLFGNAFRKGLASLYWRGLSHGREHLSTYRTSTTQLWKCAGMQLCRYAGVQVCSCAGVHTSSICELAALCCIENQMNYQSHDNMNVLGRSSHIVLCLATLLGVVDELMINDTSEFAPAPLPRAAPAHTCSWEGSTQKRSVS
ncbi:hypothetical protein JYU34_014897 [Plutella xylostella]|uniref:Uncharacterized protein n=1 Tax=Plutella xylostella TaxID=51655 RepID=A0ABQ7Q6T8_PLUXY|nr:hypothetical protein JYU34_014897 [Plutella xylostella]